MRDKRRVIVLAKACAIVGIALALHGMITDRQLVYRGGMLALLASAAVAILVTSRVNTQEIMAHQARVARLTVRERQAYAEMGWKASRLDALTKETPEGEGAEILDLPGARHPADMRRNGSA